MNTLLNGLDSEALGLVKAADALVPTLAEHAEEADASGHVSPEVFKQIVDAGLLRASVPKRLGGYQQNLQTQLAISSTLGRGCGNTAWVTQNISATPLLVGRLSEKAQREIWEPNPDVGICASQSLPSAVTAVDGGYRISGRWGFLSGVEQAGWAGLMMPVFDDPSSPEMLMGLVPVADHTVLPTWNVIGMRGTASNTLVVEDYFVPTHRVLSFTEAMAGITPTEYPGEALYRTPIAPSLALILLGAPLGMAQAALDHVLNAAGKRGITYTTYPSQSASTGFQLQVAEAAMKIDTAYLLAAQSAKDVDEAARSGGHLDYVSSTGIRARVGHAGQLLREALQILVIAHGTATFGEANPLQRMWRDVNTATSHGMLTAALGYEVLGKALVGSEERIAPLV